MSRLQILIWYCGVRTPAAHLGRRWDLRLSTSVIGFPHITDKTVSAFGHRFNECRLVGSVFECLSQLRDVMSQRDFFHKTVWPQLLKKLFLRNQRSVVLHKQQERIEGLGGERY